MADPVRYTRLKNHNKEALRVGMALHSNDGMTILSSHDAFLYLRNFLHAPVEEMWALSLTSTQRVSNAKCLFRGTVDQCLVHPRDIFRFAIEQNAAALLVAHNHPSQDFRPSNEDWAFTHRLVEAARLLQIPILDHLILTENEYCSLATINQKLFKRQKRSVVASYLMAPPTLAPPR